MDSDFHLDDSVVTGVLWFYLTGEVIEDDLSGSQSKGSRFGEDFAQYGQNEDDEADNDSKEVKTLA